MEPLPEKQYESKPFSDAKCIMEFVYGGKAIFTLVNVKSGSRFTYRINAGKSNPKYPNSLLHFVSLLSGPDNVNDYSYFGYIKNSAFVYGGAKAHISEQASSVAAFKEALQNFVAGVVPVGLEFWHANRCGRCGRTLTVPAPSGFGPECITKIGAVGMGQTPIVGNQQAISANPQAQSAFDQATALVQASGRAVRSQNPNESSDDNVKRMVTALQKGNPEQFFMDGDISDPQHAYKFWFKRFKKSPMAATELTELETQ